MVSYIVLFAFSIVVHLCVCVCVVCYRQGAPVCSVLGKTYSNECLLHKEACRKKRRIGKSHSGACLGKMPHAKTSFITVPLYLKAHLWVVWCGFSVSEQGRVFSGRVRSVPVPSDGLVLTPQQNGREIHTTGTLAKMPHTHTANSARTG